MYPIPLPAPSICLIEHMHLIAAVHMTIVHYHHMIHVTQLGLDRCLCSLERSYAGKEGYPLITYEAIVDHAARDLGITGVFADVHNDDSSIEYD